MSRWIRPVRRRHLLWPDSGERQRRSNSPQSIWWYDGALAARTGPRCVRTGFFAGPRASPSGGGDDRQHVNNPSVGSALVAAEHRRLVFTAGTSTVGVGPVPLNIQATFEPASGGARGAIAPLPTMDDRERGAVGGVAQRQASPERALLRALTDARRTSWTSSRRTTDQHDSASR